MLLSYHLPVIAFLNETEVLFFRLRIKTSGLYQKEKNRSSELLIRNDWKQIRDMVCLIDLFYIPFLNSPLKITAVFLYCKKNNFQIILLV